MVVPVNSTVKFAALAAENHLRKTVMVVSRKFRSVREEKQKRSNVVTDDGNMPRSSKKYNPQEEADKLKFVKQKKQQDNTCLVYQITAFLTLCRVINREDVLPLR